MECWHFVIYFVLCGIHFGRVIFSFSLGSLDSFKLKRSFFLSKLFNFSDVCEALKLIVFFSAKAFLTSTGAVTHPITPEAPGKRILDWNNKNIVVILGEVSEPCPSADRQCLWICQVAKVDCAQFLRKPDRTGLQLCTVLCSAAKKWINECFITMDQTDKNWVWIRSLLNKNIRRPLEKMLL